MNYFINVDLAGRLAGTPVIMNGKRHKVPDRKDPTKMVYATTPEAVTAVESDNGTFYTFTVVVERGRQSDWVDCICFDPKVLELELRRGQFVRVKGRLSMQTKVIPGVTKPSSAEEFAKAGKKGVALEGEKVYDTTVRVIVSEIIKLVQPGLKVGMDTIDSTEGVAFG